MGSEYLRGEEGGWGEGGGVVPALAHRDGLRFDGVVDLGHGMAAAQPPARCWASNEARSEQLFTSLLLSLSLSPSLVAFPHLSSWIGSRPSSPHIKQISSHLTHPPSTYLPTDKPNQPQSHLFSLPTFHSHFHHQDSVTDSDGGYGGDGVLAADGRTDGPDKQSTERKLLFFIILIFTVLFFFFFFFRVWLLFLSGPVLSFFLGLPFLFLGGEAVGMDGWMVGRTGLGWSWLVWFLAAAARRRFFFLFCLFLLLFFVVAFCHIPPSHLFISHPPSFSLLFFFLCSRFFGCCWGCVWCLIRLPKKWPPRFAGMLCLACLPVCLA